MSRKMVLCLGARALSFALGGLGCSWGLVLALLLAFQALAEDCSSVEKKMLPGDASTSNPGQSGVPASISNPATPEVPQDALGDELAVAKRSEPPLDEEIKKPLMADDQREEELERRLRFNFLLNKKEIDEVSFQDMLEKQILIEKKIEILLLNDGYRRSSILHKMNEIRGLLFYSSKGEAVKNKTLDLYLKQIENDPSQSLPYSKITKALSNYNLLLDFDFE